MKTLTFECASSIKKVFQFLLWTLARVTQGAGFNLKRIRPSKYLAWKNQMPHPRLHTRKVTKWPTHSSKATSIRSEIKLKFKELSSGLGRANGSWIAERQAYKSKATTKQANKGSSSTLLLGPLSGASSTGIGWQLLPTHVVRQPFHNSPPQRGFSSNSSPHTHTHTTYTFNQVSNWTNSRPVPLLSKASYSQPNENQVSKRFLLHRGKASKQASSMLTNGSGAKISNRQDGSGFWPSWTESRYHGDHTAAEESCWLASASETRWGEIIIAFDSCPTS